MADKLLTSDNFQLSSLTKGHDGLASERFAVNCTNEMLLQCSSDDLLQPVVGFDDLDGKVSEFARNAISENTRAAYESDIRHFQSWGGHLPATAQMIARYIADHAEQLAIATITRRIATFSKAHEMLGVENPCASALVKATLRGLRRTRGTMQRQAKALLKEDLFSALDIMPDDIKSTRDRAVLLIGFAGGFRRSELVGLNVADIETVRQGIIITLRHSKTDQEGQGRKVGIPYGRSRHCPISALTEWLARSGITEGAIFRPLNRHGQVKELRLSGDAVSTVIRDRLSGLGLDVEGFSGHSLRAGFATSAAQVGVSSLKIRAQTGHASDTMLSRYIRDGELFVGNAAGAVL